MNVWLVLSLRAGDGYLSILLALSSSICLQGAGKDKASPFAAWHCAGSLIQYSTNTGGRLFAFYLLPKEGLTLTDFDQSY